MSFTRLLSNTSDPLFGCPSPSRLNVSLNKQEKEQISEANCPKIIEMNYLVNWIKDGDGDRDFDKELLGLSELASWISVHPELQAISIENIRNSEHTAKKSIQFLDFLGTQPHITSVYLESLTAKDICIVRFLRASEEIWHRLVHKPEAKSS